MLLQKIGKRMGIRLNYPEVSNLFDFLLSLKGPSFFSLLVWHLCRWVAECGMPSKNVSLFESLILVFQHADLLWLHFWKLAALGSILWPVLWFCCELASPFLIPAQSVLLGLDAYSLCVYSTGDFITGPPGMDCVQCSVHVMGLCLRVYSKYWAISLPPLSKMVRLFIFYLLLMTVFASLAHKRSLYWNFF